MKINKYRIEVRGRGRIPMRVREETFDIGGADWESPRDIARMVSSMYRLPSMPEEHVIVMCLDTRGKPIGTFEVAHGARSSAPVTASAILRRVLVFGADYFILIHNHPSGSVTPSKDDEETCRKIREAAKSVDLYMVDFIITGSRGRYMSFLELGKMG